MKYFYLDYNAITLIAQEVVDAIQPFLIEHYGNPSSRHWAGTYAKTAIEKARQPDCDAMERRWRPF